jgi:ketosteroid isomerase-like protein
LSEENVATVRLLFESVSKDLLEAFADAPRLREAFEHYFAQDLEWVMPSWAPGNPLESHWGIDGAIAAMTDHLSPWEMYRNVPERYVGAGDKVVVLAHEEGRLSGERSEVEIEVGGVWTFRAGKIAKVEHFTSHQQALRMAGIDPAVPQAG